MVRSMKAVAIRHENDPYTYNEAMENVEANFWKMAMNVEMKSMGSKPTSSK